MSEKKIAFRSSLHGYNREDVNTYILQLNRTFEERENALKKEIDTLKADAEAVNLQLTKREDAERESTNLIAELRENLDSVSNEKTDLCARCLQLEGKLAEIESANNELLEKLNETSEKLSSINTSPSTPSDDDVSKNEKSMKYDQISAQIGDLMIHANTSADQIIAAATATASAMIAETELEENYIRARLSDAADEMLSHISGAFHVSTDNCISELLIALKEMRARTDSLIRDFEKRNRELSDRVDYYQTNVTETVQKAIHDMDEKYGVRRTDKKI